VHEKQQHNSAIRQPANGLPRIAAGRHHGREGNRQQNGREERVDAGPDGAEQNHLGPRLQPIARLISDAVDRAQSQRHLFATTAGGD